ncbi:MAG: MASE1 domain-containing protein [Proteobacteria bacterium]|nr:MASE1 domain-containing protein [Pseudomonadota bacterium]
MINSFILFIGYLTLCKFGSYLYSGEAEVAYFWPPNALVAAFLLSTERRNWGALLAVIVPAEMIVDYQNGIAPIYGFGLGIANLLESLLIAIGISKFVKTKDAILASVNDLLQFFLICVVVPVFTGLIGAAVIYANGMQNSYYSAWFLWWIGDALGLLVFLIPFRVAILHFKSLNAKWNTKIVKENINLEMVILLFLTPIICFISLGAGGQFISIPALVFPVMIWAAYRFQIRGSSIVIAEIAMVMALYDIFYGNHTGQNLGALDRVIAMQVFLVMSIGTTYLLSVAVEDRNRTQQIVEQQRVVMISHAKMAALGEMSAGIGHEINNPLTILIAKLSLMKRRKEASQIPDRDIDLKELDKLETTVFRISKIVRGLKAFSGTSDQEPMSRVIISDLVNDSLDLCRDRLNEVIIDLRITAGENVLVSCRPYQIVQVLYNLLSNSCDAISGLDSPWIEVSYFVKGQSLFIRVTDCGNGIPSEVAEKMMQPFFTTKEVGKGTGLGLSISKGLMESHGGSLTYIGNAKNTTFELMIPLDRSEASNS